MSVPSVERRISRVDGARREKHYSRAVAAKAKAATRAGGVKDILVFMIFSANGLRMRL